MATEQLNIEQVVQTIKLEFPDKAIDLSESVELLKETINDIMNAINLKSSEAFERRDFSARRNYDEIALVIHEYEQKMDQFISLLDVDDDIIENEIYEETETRKNYAAFKVDSEVVHTLYENFAHVRPFAFQLGDNKKIQVKTWKEVLLGTCELLYTINEDKFIKFESNPQMNGKKNKYIAKDSQILKKPYLLHGIIYIETNMGGNSIRNLILKMLKAYDLKPADYKVYFRADYSESNQN